MSKHGGILRQAGPLMLGRGGATVLGFALPLILTRLLPQAEFGTYKQVWLVVTTACFMLQLGLSQSLYYFIPRQDGRKLAWLTQSSISLLITGTLAGAGLYAARFAVARQFGNPQLAEYGPQMALIAMLMIAAAPLEITLTAENRVRTAAWVIFLSDAVRVGASVVPLLLGWGLRGFFWAYVLHGAVRFALQCWFFFQRGKPEIDWRLWREQLAYALPFGAAVLVDIPQRTFHQWAVGWSVDAAAFAIYAQGCFQVPIVNLLYSPISDVLQVRLAEPGGRDQRLHLFHDANLRLAAVFFPFTAGPVGAPALFVPALFTHLYDTSVPLFPAARRVALRARPFPPPLRSQRAHLPRGRPHDAVRRAAARRRAARPGQDALPVPRLRLEARGHGPGGAAGPQALRDDRRHRRPRGGRVGDAHRHAGARAARAGGELARDPALEAAVGDRHGLGGGVRAGGADLARGIGGPEALPGAVRRGSRVLPGVPGRNRHGPRRRLAAHQGAKNPPWPRSRSGGLSRQHRHAVEESTQAAGLAVACRAPHFGRGVGGGGNHAESHSQDRICRCAGSRRGRVAARIRLPRGGPRRREHGRLGARPLRAQARGRARAQEPPQGRHRSQAHGRPADRPGRARGPGPADSARCAPGSAYVVRRRGGPRSADRSGRARLHRLRAPQPDGGGQRPACGRGVSPHAGSGPPLGGGGVPLRRARPRPSRPDPRLPLGGAHPSPAQAVDRRRRLRRQASARPGPGRRNAQPRGGASSVAGTASRRLRSRRRGGGPRPLRQRARPDSGSPGRGRAGHRHGHGLAPDLDPRRPHGLVGATALARGVGGAARAGGGRCGDREEGWRERPPRRPGAGGPSRRRAGTGLLLHRNRPRSGAGAHRHLPACAARLLAGLTLARGPPSMSAAPVKKVLLVGDFPPPHGGVATHVEERFHSARDRGAECEVLDIGKGQLPAQGVVPSGGMPRFSSLLIGFAARGFRVHVHTNGANPRSWMLAQAC